MVVFLLAILVAVVLGIIGVAAKGLVYLLVIGCVLLALDVAYGVLRLRRSGQGRRQR